MNFNKIKSVIIYLAEYVVYLVKFVYWEVRRLIKVYPRVSLGVGITIIALLLIIRFFGAGFLNYLNTPRPPPLVNAPASTGYKYMATDKFNNVTAYVGNAKNNTPDVEATVGKNVNVNFELTDLNQNISQPVKSGNQVTFKNVRNNVDISYQPLVNGMKENIIVNAHSQGNAFTFNVSAGGANPKLIAPNTYGPVFFDAQGKYAFNFAEPYATDAKGIRTNNLVLRINKVAATNYTATVVVNQKWLDDPTRAYPVTIDPTVTYNTSSLFLSGYSFINSGIYNRVTDTGSGASPNLTTYYQELPTDQYTVGLWHMNESSGTTTVSDSSGNSNTGTPTGTTITTGILGNGRQFSGSSDHIDVGNNASLSGTNAYTLEAWVYLTANSGTYGIISKASYGSYSGGYDFGITTNTINGNLYIINQYASSQNILYSTTGLKTGAWYHVAAVFSGNGTTPLLYINGKQDTLSGTTTFSNPSTNSNTVYVGNNHSLTQSLPGILDEVRISNIARSAEEIRLDAQRRPYSVYTSDVIDLQGAPTGWSNLSWTELGVNTTDGETLSNTSNLVAQWNFNSTSGTTATNDAGVGTCGGTASSCNGTLTNFASTASQDQAAGTGWTAANGRWPKTSPAALMFNGSNNYVSCTDLNCGGVGKLDPGAGAWSLGAWVKTSSATRQQIISKGTSTGQYAYELWIASTGVVAYDLDNTANAAYIQAISTNTVNDGNWHYLVGTYDGTTISVYIDGRLSASSTTKAGTQVTDSTSDFQIGARTDGGWYVNGVIDSATVFSRALTASEILSNYQAGNVELQTRVGNTTDPNDGTWDAWAPTSGESQIDSMDTNLPATAPTGCTATGGASTDGGKTYMFTNSYGSVFHYTGADQTYTVPAGVTSINVKMWGAGGGAGRVANDYGGGGGYSTGTISVTPGQVLKVVVGGGGLVMTPGSITGGGSGGGYSGVFNSSISQANALLIAGGGGGGGYYDPASNGGPGGGNTGGDGCQANDPYYGGRGRGGTQSAGGIGGTYSSWVGQSGSALQGGAGIDYPSTTTWGSGGGASYGGGGAAGGGANYASGGGGGGYYGGGGGSNNAPECGGGGSGYIGGAGVSNATTTAGSGSTPANATDTDNGGAGTGGGIASKGAPGKVVITPVYSMSFSCTSGGNVDVLVVAGGGGGGKDMGGGGGGGGVIYKQGYAITANTPVSVAVGRGGEGGPAAGTIGENTAHQYVLAATNGQNSVFGTLTAIGGGFGGSSYYPYTPGAAGGSGGSGGGASGYSDGNTRAGGAGTAGQGYSGGGGGGAYYSGGGGGAGGAGTSSTALANGGIGYYSTILGTGYYFGGGGGGAGYSICGGNGGAGGGGGSAVCVTSGGSGLNSGNPGGQGSTGMQTGTPGGDAGTNTGGGGGGGSHYNFNNKGGDGGSGIVIVRLSPLNTTTSSILSTDATTKVEGTGSQKTATGALQADANTVGLWHLDETAGTGAFLSGSVATPSPVTINTGTGNDGDCIMNNGTKTLDSTAGSSVCNGSGRSAAFAPNFSVTGNTVAGSSSVTVSSSTVGLLAVGDEFFIIDLQGTSGNYVNVGAYETHTITSLSGTNNVTLNFTDSTLANTYDGTTQKIMVQRVPNFGNVTVCGGNTGGGCTAAATLTASAWNGTKGGVLFFRANGTLTINSGATITSTTLGYRGGAGRTTCSGCAGYQGESVAGAGGASIQPYFGAGGGGYYAGGSNTNGLGGNAGYGSMGAVAGCEPSCTSRGGQGNVYGNSALSKLFFGSGGGGDAYYTTTGGAGGGIIAISAGTFTNSGAIAANGSSSPQWPYYGGNGSGGSILLSANTATLGSSTVTATFGGGGRIVVYSNAAISGTTNPAAYSNPTSSVNGTPTGTTVASGVIGKARSFNGSSDYITVNSPTISVGGTKTVEAWIKTTTPQGLIFNSYDGANGYEIYVGATNGYLLSWSNGGSVTSTTPVIDGRWHHVAATWDGSTGRIYLDGALLNSAAASITTNTSNQGQIGAECSGACGTPVAGWYYKGSIDEVRVSNIARTAEEIAEDYRMGANQYINRTVPSSDISAQQKLAFNVAADRPGTYLSATIGNNAFANYQPDANTVGLWHLDEQSGSGAYIKDSSANGTNGYNGTPIGTTFIKGVIGGARSFNGSNEVITTPSYTIASTTTPITYEAWVQRTGTCNNYNVIIGHDPTNGSGGPSFICGYNGTHTNELALYSGAAYSFSGYVLGTGWTYVAMTFDGTYVRMYVNGALVSTSASTTITSGAQIFTIGGRWGTSANFYFPGNIDEVRVSNIARSAADIRAAYETGLRTHQVTIDFAAQLNSGGLIASGSTLSFIVDATKYGFSQMGSNLYPGDKIIVRENYNGTTYIAQGTVSSVTASTGAVTVESWDSGSTFPTGGQTGFSANADVFKWQKEYMDLSGSINSQKNAINTLSLRETNGNEGRSIWLDDLRSIGSYLTTPGGSTITSSTSDRYAQYRAIISSADYNVSPSISQALLGYTTNYPLTPTIGTPSNATTNSIQWNFTPGSDTGAGATTGYYLYDGSGNKITGADCSSGTYCLETGLTPNTSYTRKVVAYNDTGNSAYTAAKTLYTLAAVPTGTGATTTSAGTTTSLSLTPGAGIDPSNPTTTNPSSTQIAVYQQTGSSCTGTGGYFLNASGASNGATPLFQTVAQWGTLSLTGLNLQANEYLFCTEAENGNSVVTSYAAESSNGGYLPLNASTFTITGTTAIANRYTDGNNGARFVYGLDSGSGTTNNSVLTIAKGGSLTVLSTETVVAGSFVIKSGGLIALPKNVTTGQLKPGSSMWAIDQDADGYPLLASTLYYGTAAPTHGRRLYLMTHLTQADCDDTDSSIRTTKITGGSISRSGSTKIHTFTSSGSLIVSCPANLNISVFAIGGGGGGSGGQHNMNDGTGGAAGVARSNGSLPITSGTYTVTVGGGGARSFTGSSAGSGGTSSFGSLVVASGGGGSVYNSVYGPSNADYSGGLPGSGVGGGAGAGGPGVYVQYGGGTGGTYVTAAINGGSYGGGGGGGPAGAGGGAGAGAPSSVEATANSGSGGGGIGSTGNQYGGNGGSGIVIVGYPDP